MSISTVKTGVSLPREEYWELEKIRRKMGLSRSALFEKALSFWLKSLQEQEKIKQYIEGYKKHPESVTEIKAMEKAAAEAFSAEDLK